MNIRNLISYFVAIISIVCFWSYPSASSSCPSLSSNDGLEIGVIGDSIFDIPTEGSSVKCFAWENFLSHRFDTKNIYFVAKSGSTILDNSKKALSFSNQKLSKKPDILIIGGGGNDFGYANCGKNFSCYKKTLDKIISVDGKTGKLLEILKSNTRDDTRIYWTYLKEPSSFSPKIYKDIVSSGIVEELYKRLNLLAKDNSNFEIFNLNSILDVNDKMDWRSDGFHPSAFAALKATQVIKARYSKQIQAFGNGDIFEEKRPIKRCEYIIRKTGIDDKGKDHDYVMTKGTVLIEEATKLNRQTLSFESAGYRLKSKKFVDDKNILRSGSFIELNTDGTMLGKLENYNSKRTLMNKEFKTEAYTSYASANASFGFSYKNVDFDFRQAFTNGSQMQILYVGKCLDV